MNNNDEKQTIIDEVSIDDGVAPTESVAEPATDNSEIEKLQTQLAQMNDKYLRLAAELENTRRRAEIDAQSRARNRAMKVAEQILPVMDAIDAAKKHAPDDAGINSMAMAMESAFNQIGISRIESIGKPLNPQLHNAIQVIDAPADMEPRPAPNTIISEMQTGYMFGDTVLRTAMVVVCK